MDYESDGLKIVLPSKAEDIIAEGHSQHSCAGSYVDRAAKHECIILFLQRCTDIETPFYSIEVRGGKVTQVRGMCNRPATPEVDAFMAQWERQALHAPAAA